MIDNTPLGEECEHLKRKLPRRGRYLTLSDGAPGLEIAHLVDLGLVGNRTHDTIPS